MSTWTSFVKIWTVSNCEFDANFLTFFGLYHLHFALKTIGVSWIIIWDYATTRRTRKVSMPGSVFLHYEAYSWAGQIIQTKTFLFHYCPTQPKYRPLKTAQIYNVNFKAIWWIFLKSSSDNMLNSINDFRFISVLQWYLKVLRPFEVLLLCQKLIISLKELVNAYRHDRFCNPSFPRRTGGALV